jgi:hypothetical protein
MYRLQHEIRGTDRHFKVRYHERFRDFKLGTGNSKFTHHLIEHKNSIGPVDQIMHTLHFVNEGNLMGFL